MTAAKKMHVRNMRTDEIREVTPEQRQLQDKSVWVLVTGEDVKATTPATAPEQSSETPAPKTTPKASTPKE